MLTRFFAARRPALAAAVNLAKPDAISPRTTRTTQVSAAAPEPPREVRVALLRVVRATREAVAPYGVLLDAEVPNPGLPIPYYAGSVVEGRPLPFVCPAEPVLRVSRVGPRAEPAAWLERHLRVSQGFVALGAAPFTIVVGAPTHEDGEGRDLPDVRRLAAIEVPPGSGVLLHVGTWHEFPLALGAPATVLTLNSAEVVDALTHASAPGELDDGDVRKIEVARRLGVRIELTRG
jgi:ureidoglycolate lyase